MNIHDRARQLARAEGITESAALAELGRRGGRSRRAKYGRSRTVTKTQDVAAVESPRVAGAYWWPREEL